MRFLSLSFLLFLFINCSNSSTKNHTLPDNVQAISLLGDTLYTNSSTLPERLTIRIDSLIDVAENNNKPMSALIWEARRLGYLGEYRKATSLLTSAIEKEPNNAELLRHRGHRYLGLREFDNAISDFEKATKLIEGKEDIVEEDGLPNALNKPTSTLHTNIWYHLGLGYYAKGEFEKAHNAYKESVDASTNNDMLVASLYWYYMSLRRDGHDEQAGKALEMVNTDMDLIENSSYHKLLLVFKGEFAAEALLEDENNSALDDATIGYGIGNWHFINNRTDRAQSIWEGVYAAKESWASFGYIASEAELARRK